MKNKRLLLCGILAPIVYIIIVILGGILRPGYSHIAQAVSNLIATGAPNKPLLDLSFAFYNLLVITFGVGLVQYVHSDQQNQKKVTGTVGALCLVAEGIFGLLTLFFPEDLGGMSAAISRTGMMHIVFAGLSSLTTMLTMLLMGFWFKNSLRWQKYGLYSFISVGVVFVSGGLAAASIATGGSFAGLAERITIRGFLQWLFVISLALYSYDEVLRPLPNS